MNAFRGDCGWLGRRPSSLGSVLTVAALYLVLGLASFSTQVSHGIVTPVCFLPEGIALAAAILLGPSVWPGVFLGQLLLAMAQALPLRTALAIATINSVEAVAASLLFRRFGLQADLQRLKDLAGLLLLIFAVLQPFSATLGTATLWASGILQGGAPLAQAWLDWWVGNGMGQALVTPLLLAWLHQLRQPLWGVVRRTVLALLLLVFAVLISFQLMANLSTTALLVLFTPILVLLAIRPGLTAVSAASLAITFSALALTSRGQGPFLVDGKAEANILELNLFVLGLGLTAQILAVLLQERRAMEAELRRLAFFDPLTKLPNRRLLQQRLQELSHDPRARHQFHALIFLDLDRFKDINDTHGHCGGDLVLSALAARLTESVRSQGFVGRLGGDEFVVLLEGLGERPDQAQSRANAIVAAIGSQLRRPYALQAGQVTCSASTGLSLFQGDELCGREVLMEADRAMYDTKRRTQSQT